MEYFWWEGACNDHLIQLPDHVRADQKLKRVVIGIVQMPLKHCQSWDSNHLSGSPFKKATVNIGTAWKGMG